MPHACISRHCATFDIATMTRPIKTLTLPNKSARPAPAPTIHTLEQAADPLQTPSKITVVTKRSRLAAAYKATPQAPKDETISADPAPLTTEASVDVAP